VIKFVLELLLILIHPQPHFCSKNFTSFGFGFGYSASAFCVAFKKKDYVHAITEARMSIYFYYLPPIKPKPYQTLLAFIVQY